MPEESEGSERGQPSSVARPDREVWLETWVVLAVAVLPTLFRSFASAYFPGRSSVSPSRYDSFYLILDAGGWSALILYLIWKSGDPWSDFGLCRPRWSVDMILGLGSWLGLRMLLVVLRSGLEALS